MQKKLIFLFGIFWLMILANGKKFFLVYQQELTNRESVIRSYIDSCVWGFPFSLCRIIYNKATLGVPDIIIRFLSPLSVENIFLKSDSFFPLLLFPFYLLGVFFLFFGFRKYFFWLLIIASTLLINLIYGQNIFVDFLTIPIILAIGLKESYLIIRRHV